MEEENKAMVAADTQHDLATEYNAANAYGFEETDSKDIVIPRIKVINALSPERVDGIANEGDILNSLTQENVKGKRFIPVKQYYSKIRWNPERDVEPRILCRSFDGKVGQCESGACMCAQCHLDQFDNTKTGKDAQPKCTSYLNFLGFFEDEPMPVVLSFAKTNYAEGRKMLSIAKSMRAAIWNFAYRIDSKLVAKDRNNGTSWCRAWLVLRQKSSVSWHSSSTAASRPLRLLLTTKTPVLITPLQILMIR